MHPRIQARRESLSGSRKQCLIRALADLCGSMDQAAFEIERVAGLRPPELTEMADAYRIVMSRLASEPVSAEEIATLSERINVSAQVALVYIRTLVDKYLDDYKSSATVH